MNLRKVATAVVFGIAFLLMLPTAQAGQAITMSSYTLFTDGAWTEGWLFSPNENIWVTALGTFFPAGSTTTQGVTLWDSLGDVLATTTVTGPGSVSDGFDFTGITPLELFAGTDYVVGATTQSDDYAIDTTFTVDPAIDYISHEFTGCSGETPCFPGTGLIEDDDNFGANFEFTVPEPTCLLMLGTGLLGLFGASRRRRLTRPTK